MIPSLELAEHEPGRLSPYEDSGMKNSEKSTAIIANEGRITLAKLVPQSLDHQLPRSIEKRDFLLSSEVYARTLQTENPQENRGKSGREAAGLSSTPIRQMAKRMRVDSISDSGLSNKANSLASEELNLRLRKRVLANLGRNSRQEDAKIKQLSAGRQKINSQLMQQSPGRGDACVSSLPLPRLPQESPLKNIITFARIEEEIVQTKVQYAMAEKQLRRERQTIGRASDSIIQRVKAIGKAIAELYEAREATQADRTRIDAFRRPAGNGKAQLPVTPPITDAPAINLLSSGPVPGSEDREIRDWRAPGQRLPAKSIDIAPNSTNPDVSNPQVTFAPTDTDTFVRS
jgi:hypothetical protein